MLFEAKEPVICSVVRTALFGYQLQQRIGSPSDFTDEQVEALPGGDLEFLRILLMQELQTEE